MAALKPLQTSRNYPEFRSRFRYKVNRSINRSSSRLLKILKSNEAEHQYSTDGDWFIGLVNTMEL